MYWFNMHFSFHFFFNKKHFIMMYYIILVNYMRKKAVSPVIAIVLMIALTVAAAAIIWFVVTPMLRTTEGVMVSEVTIYDADVDFKYDKLKLSIANSGTKEIYLQSINIQNQDFGINVTWDLQGQKTLGAGQGNYYIATSSSENEELQSGLAVDIYLLYSSTSSAVDMKKYWIQSKYLPLLINASADISEPLVYRTANEDSATSRSTFPGPGYSPTLFFLLGAYKSNPSLSADYILSETGNVLEQDYRPYLNDSRTFQAGNPYYSNYKWIPYNDTGTYRGLISFTGNFDPADTLNWKGPGVVYVGFYVYNPTSTDMDVAVYYQTDDHGKIYKDGEILPITDPNWNRWSSPGYEVTIKQGYNYFLLKTQDTGGQWDAQVLFVDTGTQDDLSQLESRWPAQPLQQIPTTDPDALKYRVSADETGTSAATFPGPGYSPQKWFLLGRFIPGTRSSQSRMNVDYINANGYGNEQDYRPYIGDTNTFTTDIGTETNNSFVPYKDQGNLMGVIDFRGSSGRFDKGDTLNWAHRGIAYAGTYIYNPLSTDVQVQIACQSDDHFYLWVNGQKIIDSFQESISWNEWSSLHTITLNPGLNYILIKSGDRGGNWDVNLILKSDTVDLSEFLAVWPESQPSPLVKAALENKNNANYSQNPSPTFLERLQEMLVATFSSKTRQF